jgi:hypothetical protein
MKVVSLALAIALLAIGLAACQMPVGSGAPNLVNKSIKLTDGGGTFLGYVTSSNNIDVTIYTAKGYWVTLSWNGALADGGMLYTGTNGTGTPFGAGVVGREILGFVTIVGGQPYVAASLDTLGGAVYDPSLTSYLSIFAHGVITTFGSPQALKSVEEVGFPMKLAQYSDIGIPSSIPTPLRLVFD